MFHFVILILFIWKVNSSFITVPKQEFGFKANQYYIYVNLHLNYTNADAYCRAKNTRLATISGSLDDQFIIENILPYALSDFWINGIDVFGKYGS
jgi:hypothetical protein